MHNNVNICLSLEEVAKTQANEIALVTRHGGKYLEFSFAELQEAAKQYAAKLSGQEIKRGMRVMLMVPPQFEFYALTFALFRLGAVVILIDPGMGYRNLLRCIESVRPEALIGIPKAHLFSRLFPRFFKHIAKRICVGSSFFLFGKELDKLEYTLCDIEPFNADQSDLAAVIFTTGSTGPPKGVQYTHGIFQAQLQLIHQYYDIGPGQIDQPGFPLFGLFSTALGAKAVIPEMDPSRPAKLNPALFVRSLLDYKVSYSFGSPAIWNVVSRYCLAENIRLPVKKILMAGAPVPGELIERVMAIMDEDGEIHTPYGATESLPIVSMNGAEIVGETWNMTRQGKGICVGRALPGISIRIIRPENGVIASLADARFMDTGDIGEIIVRGPVVTAAYDHNEQETKLAKISDDKEGKIWHRMGDMGYVDPEGRLWFCGRKAHRVLTENAVLYSVCCEAIFNEHPSVNRTALVGIGTPGRQRPVLIGESTVKGKEAVTLKAALAQLAQSNPLTRGIATFLLHPDFPVDIRHNAKIFREKLAIWAARQLTK